MNLFIISVAGRNASAIIGCQYSVDPTHTWVVKYAQAYFTTPVFCDKTKQFTAGFPIQQYNCPTMVIYIDFSKAFDVVQHDKLFLKLRSYGICDVLLNWIVLL